MVERHTVEYVNYYELVIPKEFEKEFEDLLEYYPRHKMVHWYEWNMSDDLRTVLFDQIGAEIPFLLDW